MPPGRARVGARDQTIDAEYSAHAAFNSEKQLIAPDKQCHAASALHSVPESETRGTLVRITSGGSRFVHAFALLLGVHADRCRDFEEGRADGRMEEPYCQTGGNHCRGDGCHQGNSVRAPMSGASR